jgi:hypothetical protein
MKVSIFPSVEKKGLIFFLRCYEKSFLSIVLESVLIAFPRRGSTLSLRALRDRPTHKIIPRKNSTAKKDLAKNVL